MRSTRRILWGLFFSVLVLFSNLSITTVKSTGGTVFLNKIAVCNFEVGYRIAVTNTTAFVSDNNGVMIIDITSPTHPSIITHFDTGDTTFGVTIKDSVLFASAGSQGLYIVDISSPESPQLLGRFACAEIAYSFTILDNYGFLGYMGATNIAILNLTDLSSPSLLTNISGYSCDHLFAYEGFLFGASPSSGLVVFNVSNPANPSFIRSLSAPGAHDISIGDNRLFLGCHLYGLKSFNCTNPSTITPLTTVSQDDDGEAQGVVYTEGYLCVADNFGVELFDITNPYSTTKVDEFRQGISAAHDIAANGNYVFVAKGYGLGVFEISNTKSAYFPPFLYYVIPISATFIISLGVLIFLRRKKKK